MTSCCTWCSTDRVNQDQHLVHRTSSDRSNRFWVLAVRWNRKCADVTGESATVSHVDGRNGRSRRNITVKSPENPKTLYNCSHGNKDDMLWASIRSYLISRSCLSVFLLLANGGTVVQWFVLSPHLKTVQTLLLAVCVVSSHRPNTCRLMGDSVWRLSVCQFCDWQVTSPVWPQDKQIIYNKWRNPPLMNECIDPYLLPNSFQVILLGKCKCLYM